MPKCSIVVGLLFSLASFAAPPMEETPDSTPPLQKFPGQTTTPSTSESLFEPYHELEMNYRFSQVTLPAGKALLQLLLVRGEYAVVPSLSVRAGVPIVFGGGAGPTFGHFDVGVRGKIISEVIKDYPTFVNLDLFVRPPRSGSHPLLYQRTDWVLSLNALREIGHWNLNGEAAYALRLDRPQQQQPRYGNEFMARVGGTFKTGFFVDVGLDTTLRAVGDYESSAEKISGRTLLVLEPRLLSHIDQDWEVFLRGFIPLRQADSASLFKVFGDSTLSGIGGAAFSLGAYRRF